VVEVTGTEVAVTAVDVEVTSADEVGEPIISEVVGVIVSAIEVETGATADVDTDAAVPQPDSKIANNSIRRAKILK